LGHEAPPGQTTAAEVATHCGPGQTAAEEATHWGPGQTAAEEATHWGPGQTAADGVAVRVMVERMVVGIQVEMVMTETTGQLGLPGQTGVEVVRTPAAELVATTGTLVALTEVTRPEVATHCGPGQTAAVVETH
jgi:hypothetical protein